MDLLRRGAIGGVVDMQKGDRIIVHEINQERNSMT